MKISIKRGYDKEYPVYLKENGKDERVPTNKIEYKDRHYVINKKDFYDSEGNGDYGKLYCKIPFWLSDLFVYILYLIIWTLLFLSITYSTELKLIPYIIIVCINIFFIIVWIDYKTTKLQQYINIHKNTCY